MSLSVINILEDPDELNVWAIRAILHGWGRAHGLSGQSLENICQNILTQ